MKLTFGTLVIGLAISLSTGAAGAAPSPFQLVLEARHAPATFPTPSGLQHVGTFTSSSPLCPSGTAKDIASLGGDVAAREFTCSVSGARFIAHVGPLLSEHGGSGTWQIVSGTGPLADLRGRGTWHSVLLGGVDSDPLTIAFRNSWDGFADMDAAPPTIAVTSSSVRKLKRPAGAYRISVHLSVVDANGGPVGYALSLADARSPALALWSKQGRTTSRSVAIDTRVTPARSARALSLKAIASDAVGNERSFVTRVHLR